MNYGGVLIDRCHTKVFEQTVEFDASGTDALFFRFRILVSGLVTGFTSTSFFQGAYQQTGEPSGSYVNFRSILGSPRQPFTMTMGVGGASPTVILSANPHVRSSVPGSPGLDVNNGPKCKLINVAHIAGNETFRIEAEFEVCVVECGGEEASQTAAGGVLSNKWTVTDDVDHNLFTTRTYSGILRTSSGAFNPNSLRSLCVPLLQPGLRRERMAFEVSRDGLTLGWNVVDQETMYSSPGDCTNWNFRYSESTDNGTEMFSDLTVTMEGPRDCERRELVQMCAAFAHAKIVKNRQAGQVIYQYLSVTEDAGSGPLNRVTLSAKAKKAIEAPGNPVLPADVILDGILHRIGQHPTLADFGKTITTYHPDKSRGGRDEENPFIEGPISRYGAFISYLQCPCCPEHGVGDIIPGDFIVSNEEPEGETTEITATQVEEVPDPTASWLSESHAEAIYVFYQQDTTFDHRTGCVGMPVAASSTSRSPGTSQSSATPDSIKVIRLHPDICTKIVRLAGERAKKRPELPELKTFTDSNGITHTLTRRLVKPSTSWRTADGQEMFRVDAEYHFVLSRAPKDGEELEIGKNPWDKVGIQTAKLTEATESVSGLPEGQS